MPESKYRPNSKELRNTIYRVKKNYDKRGVCTFCGKELKNKRLKWCRDEKNPDKYGACIGKYLAQRGYFQTETSRRNREKHGTLTCEMCKIAIKDLDMPAGDTRYIFDHIQPIALGGDPINPDNIQIICVKCNKIKTRNDIKEIAEQRRQIKDERARLKEEERLNKIYGKKSKWASLSDFQGGAR